MRKLALLLSFLICFWTTFAQVDTFEVNVSKSPAQVNESVDLTIKALDAQGNVVKDYTSDVLIEALDNENNSMDSIASYPNDGFYTFKEKDQWEKTFSKWLKMEEAGDYVVKITDLLNDWVTWEEKFVVTEEEQEEVSWTIDISSPADWGKESSLPISVIAESNLPNSPVAIYVDWAKLKEEMTDKNGWVNIYLNDIRDWKHSLQLKIVNSNNEVVASSDEINFTFQSPTKNFYKSLEIMPSKKVIKGDVVKIKANVSSNATSVSLTIENIWDYPMKKESEWVFEKEISMNKVGTFSTSLDISDWKNNKVFSDLEEITVEDKEEAGWSIKNVKYYKAQEDWVKVEWKYTGDIKEFNVVYWEDSKNLSQEKKVEKNSVVLPLEESKDYFLKVVPLDENWEKKWNSSDIVNITLDQHWAPTCSVKGIKLNTEKRGDNYFLTWDDVDWVQKYIVYKSSKEEEKIEDMQKVKEVEDNSYQYPFDPEASENKYANYAVVAKCSDWVVKQIDQVKKVKVGPKNTIIMLLILSLFSYLFYKLYSYSRE